MKRMMLTVIVLLTIILTINAQASDEYSLQMTTENVDLATAVSEGWIFNKYHNDNADIYQGTYLRANQTDGRAFLTNTVTVPANTTALVMEYTGILQNSYWGQNTGVFIVLNNGEEYGFHSGMNGCCDYKDTHQLVIRHGNDFLSHILNTLTYGVYHYTVIFAFNEITAQAENSQGEIVYNATVSAPGLNPADIASIKYWVYTTTNNNSWMKDLSYSFIHHEKTN